jgi:hypothetical protein
MKKGEREMGVWSAILVSVILSEFSMRFEGEGGEGIGYYEA